MSECREVSYVDRVSEVIIILSEISAEVSIGHPLLVLIIGGSIHLLDHRHNNYNLLFEFKHFYDMENTFDICQLWSICATPITKTLTLKCAPLDLTKTATKFKKIHFGLLDAVIAYDNMLLYIKGDSPNKTI